jgi:hypothetical protein
VRPTLLGIVTLAFLLLFFLLATGTGWRWGAVPIRVSGQGAAAARGVEGALPAHRGPVRDARVLVVPDGTVEVRFQARTTDIAAASTTDEARVWTLPSVRERPDGAALRVAIERLHALDPAQDHVALVPRESADSEEVMALLDILRGPDDAPTFRAVAVETGP